MGLLLWANRDAAGKSVLYRRKTAALTWSQERVAAAIGRIARFWDPDYYRTYPYEPGQPGDYMPVQQEVTRALATPKDFIEVPANAPHYRKKTGWLSRDSMTDARPAWVVCDGNYVPARWPGDVHTFAKRFSEVLATRQGR